MMTLPRLATFAFLAIGIAVLGGCAPRDPATVVENVRKQHADREYGHALVELKSLLQQHPDHGEARYLLGMTYLALGDYASAEQEFVRARALEYDAAKVAPAHARALLKLGKFGEVLRQTELQGQSSDPKLEAERLTLRARAFLGLGRHNEGSELFNRALSIYPGYAESLLGQGVLALLEHRTKDAARLVDQAIERAPELIEAWLIKGDVLQAMSDRAGALAAYRKALEIERNNIPARISIVKLHIGSGATADARKELDEVRKLAPGLPLTQYLLAQIDFREKKYATAREAILKALKSAPEYLPAVLLAGAIEHALGAYSQAIAHLTKYVRAAPDNLYAQKLLAMSLAKSGDMPRALESVRRILQHAPQDPGLNLVAGELHMQTNEFEKAVGYFEKAAAIEPRNVNIRTALGLGRFAAGEADRGIAELNAAVKLDDESYSADVALITLHLRRGDYEQAMRALQSLESKQPNNPLTHHLKGLIQAGRNDRIAARKSFEKALELNSTYAASAAELARMDLEEKNPARARRRLEAILEKDPNNAAALSALAYYAPRIGASRDELIGWLERARKVKPDAIGPQLMLADIYVRGGEARKGLEIVQEVAAAHPDNPAVLDRLGAIQMSVGEKAQALRSYEKLNSLQPNSFTYLVRLAMAQELNGDSRAAASTLRKALALDPNSLDANVSLGALELKARNYPAAIKIARHLQKQFPKRSAGHILEGDVLMTERKFADAIGPYKAAYALENSKSTLIKLHAAYLEAGRIAEAEALIAASLRDNPKDANLRRLVAETYFHSGKYGEAIKEYEWLLEKEPGNVQTLNNLALVYKRVGDPRALEMAKRAYDKMPQNPAIMDTFGWLLAEEGRTDEGLKLLEKAVAAAPKAHEIRLHLIKVLLKTGKRARAEVEIDNLLRSSPSGATATEARKLQDEVRR